MTKKADYIIRVTYDDDYQGYVADVVNLFGCMSQGKTKSQALSNVKKAIRAYMEALDLDTPIARNLMEYRKESVSIPLNFAHA